MQTYSAKSAAIRAARAALGPEAIPGTDFALREEKGRWAWEEKAPTASPAPAEIADGIAEALGAGIGKGEALAAGTAMHAAMLEGATPEEAIQAGQDAAEALWMAGEEDSDVLARAFVESAEAAGMNASDVASLAQQPIAAISSGEANHFVLNEAGKAAVAKAREEAKAPRISAKFKEAMDLAQQGIIPPEPDFTAATHKRWRPKLADVVALAAKGDVEGLRAYEIKPVSTSPKAIARYRDLAVIAIEARA
jgi:hypothetical protein